MATVTICSDLGAPKNKGRTRWHTLCDYISSLYSLPLNTRSEKILYQPLTSLKSQFFLRAIMEHCSWLGWGHMTLPFKVLMLAVNLIGSLGEICRNRHFSETFIFFWLINDTTDKTHLEKREARREPMTWSWVNGWKHLKWKLLQYWSLPMDNKIIFMQ